MLMKILMDKEGEGGGGAGGGTPTTTPVLTPTPVPAPTLDTEGKPIKVAALTVPEVKAYEFNADNYVMKIDGKEVKVKDKDELIRLAQMGQDYTNKTKTLSTDRSKMVAEIETRAKTLFEAARKAEGTNENENEPADEQTEQGKQIAELKSKLEAMESSSSSKEANAKLDTLMSTLHDTHKGLDKTDEKLIMMRFNEQINDETDAKVLFDSLFAERLKERTAYDSSVIKKFIEGKAKDPFVVGETGKSGTPGTKLATPPKTMAEARLRADARIEAARGTK